MKQMRGWLIVVGAVLLWSAMSSAGQDGRANLNRLLDETTVAQAAPEPEPVAVPIPEPPAAAEAPAVEAPAVEAPAAEAPKAPSALGALRDAVGNLPAEQPAAPAAGEQAPAAPVTEAAAVEEAAASEDVPGAPVAPATPEEAKLAAEQEEVRRQALEKEGAMAVAAGQTALRQGDYAAAAQQFKQAVAKLPVRDQTDALRTEAREGWGEAGYRLALAAYDDRNYARARELCAEVTDQAQSASRAADARSLVEKVKAREAKATIEPPPEIGGPIKKLRNRPDVVQKHKTLEDLMREGRAYYEIDELDLATASFEQVLLRDRYNKDAMRFLKKIEERKYRVNTLQRDVAAANLTEDVRGRWSPPIRQPMKAPTIDEKGKLPGPSGSERLLHEKMAKIIIPAIEFTAANIEDVVQFLREASEKNDTVEGTGVNIILKLEGSGGAAPAPAVPGMEAMPPADFTVPSLVPRVTLSLRDVSLLDALKWVTDVANLKWRPEGKVVIITSETAVDGTMFFRAYPVQPNFEGITVQQAPAEAAPGGFDAFGAAGGAVMKRDDVRAFFEGLGVSFPAGSSVKFDTRISKLLVMNSAENHERIERILQEYNLVPSQVEIEARFVEIAQNDLIELGLEWLLTDHWEVATKKGPGPISSKERVQINQNSQNGGFTRVNRRLVQTAGNVTAAANTGGTGLAGVPGALMTVSSILTNPEMSLVLHAMAQKGNQDILSAPRVTTKSGVNAQIQSVREIIYPTEFEEQAIGDLDPDRPPIPSSFQTRQVGVILNVTPTVGSDGYTIDLTMVPEVSDLVDWIDYTPPQYMPTTGAGHMRQPVFESRHVTTSVVVWDGQTVVMGGLVGERSLRLDDKIPIIGDIPLVGHLFRNKGESSQKRNLVVFVTAKLVDPAGNLLHPPETGGGLVQKPVEK